MRIVRLDTKLLRTKDVLYNDIYISVLLPENERMSPEKEVSSSKRNFQRDMLVFGGVHDMI